jgi:cytochrome c-type biogenesis protein CcmE
MNKVHKRRLGLLLAGVFVLASVSGLILYALRQNISLFYTPRQLAQAQVNPAQLIRLGGMVVKGSVIRKPHTLLVSFELTDLKSTVLVEYAGILPDLFREGQGIVAIGHLVDQTHFTATEVLAKHDEKYMPPGILEKQS